LDHPETLQLSRYSTILAQKHFDYNILAARVRDTIRTLLDIPGSSREISGGERASSGNTVNSTWPR
jgi:hypothetical protein